MRGYLLPFFICLNLFVVRAQTTVDSLSVDHPSSQKMSIINYKFKPTHLILPVTLITAGVIGHSVDDMKDFKLFDRRETNKKLYVDDYLEWGMFGWVFLADLVGKEKHNWVDQLLLLSIAEGINATAVHTLKNRTAIERPDGMRRSFPSGHTANAFLGAHLNFKEFKDSSLPLALSAYPVALFVAGARLYSNRHWVADVIAGAGFGILSVELSYLIYFPIRNAIARQVNSKAAKNLVVSPVINPQGGGFYISYVF